MPTPVGVIEHGTGERHHIGFAVGNDRLGLPGRGDQSDRACGDTSLALHLLGELDIGAGDDGGPGVGADAARGNADEIESGRLERTREADPVSYTHLTLPTNREV